jgi:hypothetical protein
MSTKSLVDKGCVTEVEDASIRQNELGRDNRGHSHLGLFCPIIWPNERGSAHALREVPAALEARMAECTHTNCFGHYLVDTQEGIGSSDTRFGDWLVSRILLGRIANRKNSLPR